MSLLLEIYIENYKAFTTEQIKFEDVTCVVGANESGKTNLIDVVYHLSPKRQNSPFEGRELRIGAPGYPSGEIRIIYRITLMRHLLGQLYPLFPNIEGKTFCLTKKGIPGRTPLWEGKIDLPQNSVEDLIVVKNKTQFAQNFKSSRKEIEVAKQRCEREWFLNDSSVDLRKQPFRSLLEHERIELISGKEKIGYLADILKKEVLKNIKVFKWSYKEGDFLLEIVPIADLIANPNKFKTVASLFEIAGWKKIEFSSLLQNQDDSVYENLFDRVERVINGLIKKNWTTHKNLKVELQHKHNYLTIHLKETGSSTPPEYRSDGLKWFLTFLINLRAQSETLSNYILLIDEPGLNLHPRGQKDTLQELEVLSQERKNQIIYTTHQTFMINKNCPKRIRIIERQIDKSGILIKNPFYASKVSNISNPRNILMDRLLREALGFKVSDISPINEKNILVEGVFDRDVFHIINDYWQIIDLNEISIISCGGASDIAKHASLYKSNGLKVICFYDSDSAGNSSYRGNKKVTNLEKKRIRDYVEDPTYETMEDLTTNKIFNLACEKWFKIWSITEQQLPQRPRIKSLKNIMQGDEQREMKHSLEDMLVKEIKENLKGNEDDFQHIRVILQDLKGNFY